MKRILSVVDFNEGTEKVLEIAANIANASKAKLIVLYPYRLIDKGYQGDVSTLKAKLESEAKEKFQKLNKSLPFLEKSSCEFYAEVGFITNRVSAYLSKSNIDMVIIGEQQANSENHKNGSNLQNLISTSRVPIVMVPNSSSEKNIYTVQQ